MSEKVYRLHAVTDQGNGGAYCSKCGHELNDFTYRGDWGDLVNTSPPNPCLGCGSYWIDSL